MIIHVVQRGDTQYYISIRYSVGMDLIQAANRLPDPGRLIVGQALVIPTPPGPRPVIAVNGYLPDTGARGQRIVNELGRYMTYATTFSYQVTSDGTGLYWRLIFRYKNNKKRKHGNSPYVSSNLSSGFRHLVTCLSPGIPFF